MQGLNCLLALASRLRSWLFGVFPRLASGWRRGKAARQPWSLGLLFWLQPFAESGKALVLKTLSQFSACDLYINVLLFDSHFRIYIYGTNQLVGQKEYRVDNGLVAICTCRGLLKTAKYPSIDYLCSFTVEHVFAAHVLAKLTIFDEIMEKFQFSNFGWELMIWNNFLKMGVFWSISLRKQCMSARDSTSERVFGLSPIIEAGSCSYWCSKWESWS